MLEGPDASKFALTGDSLAFKGAASGDAGYFRPNFEISQGTRTGTTSTR